MLGTMMMGGGFFSFGKEMLFGKSCLVQISKEALSLSEAESRVFSLKGGCQSDPLRKRRRRRVFGMCPPPLLFKRSLSSTSEVGAVNKAIMRHLPPEMDCVWVGGGGNSCSQRDREQETGSRKTRRKKERACHRLRFFSLLPESRLYLSPTWLQNFIALLEHKEGENKASE